MEEASRTLTDALEVARAIADTYRRAEVLGAVASALAQAGTIAPALEVARAIEDTSWRAAGAGCGGVGPCTSRQNGGSLSCLAPWKLYNYLGAITPWLPSLEKLEPGLSVAVVREVVRIIGWVWPQWHKVYDILAQPR